MLQNTEKLRLDPLQREALEGALREVKGEVYLFGSRVKPDDRGGDVDVLVVSDEEQLLALTLDITRRFQKVCDERIDVTVFPNPQRQSKEQRDFFDSIQKVRIK